MYNDNNTVRQNISFNDNSVVGEPVSEVKSVQGEQEVKENLLDLCTNVIIRTTDAPEIYAKSVCYWVVSTLLGKYVVIMGTPEPHAEPNIYVVLVGPPGIPRKSTVIAYAERIVKEVLGDKFNDYLIVTGSVEGIVDQIEVVEEKYNDKHVFIISYEFGTVLEGLYNKDWQLGVPGLLSSLYSGEPFKQSLSKRDGKKNREIYGVRATLLGAMQDPTLYIDNRIVGQGLFRRLIIVKATKDDFSKERYKPLIDIFRIKVQEEFDKLVELFKRRIEQFKNKNGKIQVYFSPDVESKLNEVDRNLWEKSLKAFDEPNNPDLYLGTDAEKLLKLTVLEALADLETKTIEHADGTYGIWVEPKHFERAKKFYDQYLAKYRQILEDLLVPKKKIPVPSEEEALNKILRTIQEKGHNGAIGMGALLKFTNLSKEYLRKYLETLLERGDVYVVVRITGKKKEYIVTVNREKAEILADEKMKQGVIAKVYDSSNYQEFIQLWTEGGLPKEFEMLQRSD